jgi:hypothetical protein
VLIIGEVHTMQAPYLNKSNFILVLVHHVKIPKILHGRDHTREYGKPDEHIFAFTLGLNAKDISNIVKALRWYWETTVFNPKEVALTARLFLAAALKVYGFRVAQKSVREAFGNLGGINKELKDLKGKLENEKSEKAKAENAKSEKDKYGEAVAFIAEGEKKALTEDQEMKSWKHKFDEQIDRCTSLSLRLMQMDETLPGVRSRVHFVSLCAQGLLRDESHIHKYFEDHLVRLGEEILEKGDSNKQITEALGLTERAGSETDPQTPRGKTQQQVVKELLCLRYKRRDDDKLDMLNRGMQQFEVDIKSLKARANIAIGLVSTEYARSQGNFQDVIIQATERDGSAMRKMSTWTVLLLPATFLAVGFTSFGLQPQLKFVDITDTCAIDFLHNADDTMG